MAHFFTLSTIDSIHSLLTSKLGSQTTRQARRSVATLAACAVLALGFCARGVAQIAVLPGINTVAGNGTNRFFNGDPASSAQLSYPEGVAVDAAGNLYIADASIASVLKVNVATGIITTIAGNGTSGFSGDGGPATSAELYLPQSVAVDSAGNVYIADMHNNRIREVNAKTGIITTVAGNGTGSYSGDGGPATSAELNTPYGVAVDSAGNIYIADTINNRIREVNAKTGIITTVAGNGAQGYSGDGGPATSAELNTPYGVAVDSAGNLYIADTGNNRIREVNAKTGIITTVAGNGTQGYSGDGGPATSAELYNPSGMTMDAAGNLYIADTFDNRVREVNAKTGIITTIAGTGTAGYSGDGGPATAAELNISNGVAVDSAGNLYIADMNNSVIREVSPINGALIAHFPTANVGSSALIQDVSIKLTAAQSVTSITAGKSLGGIQEYTVGAISGCTVNGSTVNAAGTVCTVPITFKPAYPGPQNVPLTVVTNTGTYKVTLEGIGTGPQVALPATGTINTVAGNGTAGYSGDGGPATAAELNTPRDVSVNYAGNIFIADTGNNRIREINAQTGIITTVAGDGAAGYSGDGGPATDAELNDPVSVTADDDGDIYIGDFHNNRVRKVDLATGIITTVAGNGTAGFSGDGGPATSAELNGPSKVALDGAGNLYIMDALNDRVREVNAQTGIITTIAGDGTTGFSGDGGPATGAELDAPQDIAVDGAGDVFIADEGNARVREVNAATGIITTIAGNGQSSNTSPDQATGVALSSPEGVAVDSAGNVYFSDNGLYVVAVLPKATGGILTVAGDFTEGYSGDGGQAENAELDSPLGVAVDSAGNVYYADASANRIREINEGVAATTTFPTPTGVGQEDTTDGSWTGNVLNTGNMPLTFTIPSSGTNPSYPAAFPVDSSATNLCSSTAAPLASGASCKVSANFQPTVAGTNTGTIVLTDNALNAANATQSFSVSGTGVATPTITWATPAAITYGTALSSTQLDATASVPGTLVYSPAAGTVLSPGTEVLSVTFTPTDTTDYGTATATVNLTVTQAGATVTWPTPAAIVYGTALSSTQLDATASVPGTFVYSPAAGVILDGGTHTLSVTFTPTDTTEYKTTVTTTDLAVMQAPISVTVGSSLEPSVYGDPVDFSFNFTGVSGGSVPTGSATIMNGRTALGTVTITASGGASFTTGILPVGTNTVEAVYGGNANYLGGAPLPIITTVVGDGKPGSTGDGGPAASAGVVYPRDVFVDAAGNLYIVSGQGEAVREVNASPCIISTVAGDKTAGFSGDGGPATAAELNFPVSIAVDGSGNLYIADQGNNRIREVNAKTGIISTIAGNGTAGFSGDGGSATSAELRNPSRVAVDSAGNIYISDSGNNRIREVNAKTGIISTIAGNGTAGFSGDDGPATSAELKGPNGIAVNAAGNIFISDQGNDRVREVNAKTGIITTVAGTGTAGYNGDGGPATEAEIDIPQGVAVSSTGSLYIADYSNQRIREVSPVE